MNSESIQSEIQKLEGELAHLRRELEKAKLIEPYGRIEGNKMIITLSLPDNYLGDKPLKEGKALAHILYRYIPGTTVNEFARVYKELAGRGVGE